MNYPKLATGVDCTGCLACIDICNIKALSKIMEQDGHFYVELDKKKCVKCGRCQKVCPVSSSFNYGNNNVIESKAFAAWADDDSLRVNAPSGGIFSSLAEYVLSIGGVVVGAELQGIKVRHVIIQNKSEIFKLRGSKYCQSDTEGIYLLVGDYLKAGKKILFSGLGCQVAALISYLEEMKLDMSNLILVDLICGGVPSYNLIKAYFEEFQNFKAINSFRNNRKYEFTVVDNNGVIVTVPLSERPLPLCGFYLEFTNRYSCYNCRFCYAHRKSDFTIGDFWGDKKYIEEHRKGISVIISHTDKALALLPEINVTYNEIDWSDFVYANYRMIYGKSIKRYSYKRKRMCKAFGKMDYNELVQTYAPKFSIVHPISSMGKIFSFLSFLLYKKIVINFKINCILNNRYQK